MTRRDVNEGDVFRKGFATNALEKGATEGQVPAVSADGEMAFANAGGGSQAGAVRWLGPCKTNAWAAQNFNAAGASADGGTFKLSLGAEQTAAIAWNATPAQVIAALAALPSVGADGIEANPRIAGGPDIDSGYSVQFKDLTATAMLTGDGAGLTGPDAPYAINFGTDNQLIEMFTPAVGDIIEDFMHVVVAGLTGALLYYTDSIAHPTQNGPAWTVPSAGQGVNGLDLSVESENDFTNFSGTTSSQEAIGQPTALLALIDEWALTTGGTAYTSVPAMALNAVPVYSYITGIDNAPTQGEVWIFVKVSTPAPLMD